MKKIIVALTFSISCLVGCLFWMNSQTASAAVVSQPVVAVDFPGNPYCPATYPPMPILECPYGSSMNVACATACMDAYDSAIADAYSKACQEWGSVTDYFEDEIGELAAALEICLHGATPEQAESCIAAASEVLNSLVSDRNAAYDVISTVLDARVATAAQNLADCALDCCEQ